LPCPPVPAQPSLPEWPSYRTYWTDPRVKKGGVARGPALPEVHDGVGEGGAGRARRGLSLGGGGVLVVGVAEVELVEAGVAAVLVEPDGAVVRLVEDERVAVELGEVG
jgi:hypothetical protein